MFLEFFRKKNKCSHRNFSPFSGGDFCPDCGKRIEITWLLLRCSCCNSKRKSRVAFNTITPLNKFCVKCGETDCYIEKKENPEFFDIEYAIVSKREKDANLRSGEVLQIWIEKEDESPQPPDKMRFIPILGAN